MHKYCGYAPLYEPSQPRHPVSWTEVPLVGLCMTMDFVKAFHPPPSDVRDGGTVPIRMPLAFLLFLLSN